MKKTLSIRVLVLFTLLFSVFTHEASAQSVKALIKRYKAMPEVLYADSTDGFKAKLKEAIAVNDPEIRNVDANDLQKHLKRVEYLMIENNSGLAEQLTEDIRSLKGYETLLSAEHNPKMKKDGNPVRNLVSGLLNPTLAVSYFGKPRGERQVNPIVAFRFGPSLTMLFLEGKIKTKDLFASYEDMSFSFDDNDDDEAFDFSALKKDGEVLFVINGVAHPELLNSREAYEYMKQHDIQINHMGIITGEEKDRKYPDTDKKTIIEYREDKE